MSDSNRTQGSRRMRELGLCETWIKKEIYSKLTEQAKNNRRTIRAELDLILEEYFKTKATLSPVIVN